MASDWTYEVHELSEGFSAIVYDANGQMVADHLDEPTARLIAAAPELVEALADLMSYHNVPGPVDAPLKPLLAAGFAALAKARGEA